jgi:hypothetical protein
MLYIGQAAYLDDGKRRIVTPAWHNIEERFYKYYIKDTLNYLLHEFLSFGDSRNEMTYLDVILIFENLDEQDNFEYHVTRNMDKFNDYYENEDYKCYNHVYSDNISGCRINDIEVKMKTGLVLNRMLDEFRGQHGKIV